ncbi:MAG: [Burkholderiaceae bacterium]|nr:[FeFe] hydrogenase H-cluster radical SAM maturase HydE [Burkholderiaceae bacterium]
MLKEKLKQLVTQKQFTDEEIVLLLGLTDPEDCRILRDEAYARTTELMGDKVYYRGLIEFSNICTANCRYCGIRKANHQVNRYLMTKEEIVEQAVWAANQGYGSVCLQSGERHDEKYINFVCEVLEEIHQKTVSPILPNGVGITLSLGDHPKEVYERWAQASGNRENLRYLARFETSNQKLFDYLHSTPGKNEKNLQHRFECLKALRECGYQVGTGVMIGIPGQTLEDLCRDIRTFQKVDADMIGMGPYLMSEGAELGALGQRNPKELMQLSLNMIAVTRLVLGNVNIAAATALQVLEPEGREMGIEYGCNIVMPNISPLKYRAGYQLYDNKPCIEDEPTQCASCLERRILSRGRKVGWNLSGSSRKWLQRNRKPDEKLPFVSVKSDEKRQIWIKAI